MLIIITNNIRIIRGIKAVGKLRNGRKLLHARRDLFYSLLLVVILGT